MELMLNRDIFGSNVTLSQFFIQDQFYCYSLEDTVREIEGVPVEEWKIPKRTAIPFGRYAVLLENSKRFQMVTPHLQDVPGFTAIEIHPGNTQLDTEGCILVGTQRDQGMLQNSRIAFTGLMARLQATSEPLYITIA